jgi:hypothetical protein
MSWIAPERAARILSEFYAQIGVEVTYDQILQSIYENCESGKLACITVPPHMDVNAELN